MKKLTDFLPEVMPSVPGCPIPLVINAVRNSVIEFLREAPIVEKNVAIPLVPGQASYAIPVPAGLVATLFVRGAVNGVHAVYPATPSGLDDDNANWREITGQFPVRAFIEGGNLTISPKPTAESAGYQLSATVAVTLSRLADEVEDDVLERWLEGIASGALSRLFVMPGYAWTNAELSAFHKNAFEIAKSEARVFRMKGGTNASIAVTPRRFG